MQLLLIIKTTTTPLVHKQHKLMQLSLIIKTTTTPLVHKQHKLMQLSLIIKTTTTLLVHKQRIQQWTLLKEVDAASVTDNQELKVEGHEERLPSPNPTLVIINRKQHRQRRCRLKACGVYTSHVCLPQ